MKTDNSRDTRIFALADINVPAICLFGHCNHGDLTVFTPFILKRCLQINQSPVTSKKNRQKGCPLRSPDSFDEKCASTECLTDFIFALSITLR
ncbi:hypothetical protein JTB14_000273 [Gonioctena quinquepunctata]|nr:hypothetical protein JTB14_000273 [Gonioctena quinquepunctata]